MSSQTTSTSVDINTEESKSGKRNPETKLKKLRSRKRPNTTEIVSNIECPAKRPKMHETIFNIEMQLKS